MLSNSVLDFVARNNFLLSHDYDYAYGYFDRRIFTLMSGVGFTYVFVPLAGMPATTKEKEEKALKEINDFLARDFESDANNEQSELLLCTYGNILRIKFYKPTFHTFTSSLKRLIKLVCRALDELAVPKRACLFTGMVPEVEIIGKERKKRIYKDEELVLPPFEKEFHEENLADIDPEYDRYVLGSYSGIACYVERSHLNKYVTSDPMSHDLNTKDPSSEDLKLREILSGEDLPKEAKEEAGEDKKPLHEPHIVKRYALITVPDLSEIDFSKRDNSQDKKGKKRQKDRKGDQIIMEKITESQKKAIAEGLAPSEERLDALAAKSEKYHEEMLKTLEKLCAIPSVKAEAEEGAPYGKGPLEALNCFLDLAKGMGFRVKNVDNRIGWLEFGEGEKLVAVACHLDVVPVGTGWKTDPFKLLEKDGFLIARGVADDKGPAVASLYALKAMMDDGYEPPCRIRMIVGTDEECGSSCLAHYAKHEEIPDVGFTADAEFPAVYAEKGHLTFYLEGPLRTEGEAGKEAEEKVLQEAGEKGEKLSILSVKGGAAFNMVAGSCEYELSDGSKHEVTGKQAHASLPWNGDNAVQKAMAEAYESCGRGAGPLLDFFADCFGMENDGKSIGVACSDDSGPLTFNIANIDGKTEDNLVRIGIDIRYPISFKGEEIMEKIAAKAKEYGFAPKEVDDDNPLDLGKDSILISTLMKSYNECCGTKGEAKAIGGGTYARKCPNIAAYGMMFPGDPDCMHQANEFIEKRRLFASMEIYRDSLQKLAENYR